MNVLGKGRAVRKEMAVPELRRRAKHFEDRRNVIAGVTQPGSFAPRRCTAP